MRVFYENIPAELKSLPRWVCWRFEQRGGKATKVPYTPTGRRAKSNDPATWAAFDECRAAHESGSFDGIGFQLDGSGIVGVDIDHARDAAGNWSATAADITERLASYAEISPSGEGVHIFIKAVKPGSKSKNAAAGVEMYDTKRFFTVTGNLYREGLNAVQERQEALKGVYFKYLEPPQNVTATTGQEKHAAVDFAPLDDAAIIELFESGKAGGQKSDRGKELQAYWKGMPGLYTDDLSTADLSLCNALAFWTQKDTAQMDRLFRQSGLYLLDGRAEKWNTKHNSAGQTYGEMTIAAAVAACNVVYSARNLTGRFNNELVVKQNFPVLKADGKPVTTHWQNLSFLLERWGLLLKYNEISKEIELYKNGQRQPLAGLQQLATDLRGRCNASGLGISRADIFDQLEYIAKSNKYNPFTDYLESCFNKWTAAGGQKVYFAGLCTALKFEPAFMDGAAAGVFLHALLRKWLLQAVKLAYNDGSTKPQSLLVLQGAQGIGKTRFISWLLPVPSLVLTEQSLDPASKDSVIKVTKYALVEVSEMGRSMKDKDLLKQFFTSPTDTYRAPFERDTVTHPRKTSFAGTVNNLDFLIDRTGERRYFVLPLAAIDWQALERLPPAMLWGEIYAAAIVDCERFWLNSSEIKQLNQHNKKFALSTSTEEGLYDLLDWGAAKEQWQYYTAARIALLLFNDKAKAGKAATLLKAMAASGEIDKPVHKNNYGASWLYLLPPIKRL
ncbi:VapE family protein [Phascolarctobacterium faecium]|nr:VapE domain-containing protein [Phascolarctobacterium faecium]MDM8111772.1 VapE family protein [Phascolarctobacterium faecium]